MWGGGGGGNGGGEEGAGGEGGAESSQCRRDSCKVSSSRPRAPGPLRWRSLPSGPEISPSPGDLLLPLGLSSEPSRVGQDPSRPRRRGALTAPEQPPGPGPPRPCLPALRPPARLWPWQPRLPGAQAKHGSAGAQVASHEPPENCSPRPGATCQLLQLILHRPDSSAGQRGLSAMGWGVGAGPQGPECPCVCPAAPGSGALLTP